MKHGVGDAERLALQWSYGPTGTKANEFLEVITFLAGGQDNGFDSVTQCEKMKVFSLLMLFSFGIKQSYKIGSIIAFWVEKLRE